MEFAIGQLVAYLKVGALAAAVMAVVWSASKLSVWLYNRRHGVDAERGDRSR